MKIDASTTKVVLNAKDAGNFEVRLLPPRSTALLTSPPGATAPPVTPTLKVPGWRAQTQDSPWSSVSPNTVAAAGKYKAPTTFGWIGTNDPGYIKWVLCHSTFSDPRLQQMKRYFSERYERDPMEPDTEPATKKSRHRASNIRPDARTVQETAKELSSDPLHPLSEVPRMLQSFRTIIAEMQAVLGQMHETQARHMQPGSGLKTK